MVTEYVEKAGEAYRVTGTRVSLDSVVYAFWNGASAEAISQSYPELTLEQVYGTIAYYLAHHAVIDDYIRQGETDYDRKRQAARQADPMFYQKMADARQRMKTPA
ncbi:MAG TPA: DUF433 domain-containing protein [Blastocatellia bacterium]|nr:DUF433 domain-containing protein [Blastocatellia bacterium]